jgi:exosortase
MNAVSPRTTAAIAPPTAPRRWAAALLGAGLLAALAWSYWPALVNLEERWRTDPQYSHGFLVPAFALVVLWRRRKSAPADVRPSAWGVAGLMAAAGLRLAGGYFYFDWLEGLSLLLSLAAVAVLAGGFRFGRWLLPALAVLLFLFPLPFQAGTALAGPLRQLATQVGTYALQTLGFAAVAEGNVVVVGDFRIGVAEACSGLGMLWAFFALSTTVALVVRRPMWERVVLFLSAAPIGVLMNLLRITATAWVFCTLGAGAAHTFFHDLAGWLMMPLAFAALWLELEVLGRVFVAQPAVAGPVPLTPGAMLSRPLPAVVNHQGQGRAAKACHPSQVEQEINQPVP